MLGTSQAGVNSAPPREAARRRAHYAPLMSKIVALVADFRWVAGHKPAATPNAEPCPMRPSEPRRNMVCVQARRSFGARGTANNSTYCPSEGRRLPLPYEESTPIHVLARNVAGTIGAHQSAEPEGLCCRCETTRKCQSVITIPIGSCKHPVADLYL